MAHLALRFKCEASLKQAPLLTHLKFENKLLKELVNFFHYAHKKEVFFFSPIIPQSRFPWAGFFTQKCTVYDKFNFNCGKAAFLYVFFTPLLFYFQCDTFAAVYKKLTGKEVTSEFSESYL